MIVRTGAEEKSAQNALRLLGSYLKEQAGESSPVNAIPDAPVRPCRHPSVSCVQSEAWMDACSSILPKVIHIDDESASHRIGMRLRGTTNL